MQNKHRLLRNGLVFDGIGMLTTAIPVVGPFLDLAWAPFAAKKMTEMYPGKKGKLMSAITFLEELLPFTDFVPTFTLMWVYTFVLNGQKEAGIIEAEIIA